MRLGHFTPMHAIQGVVLIHVRFNSGFNCRPQFKGVINLLLSKIVQNGSKSWSRRSNWNENNKDGISIKWLEMVRFILHNLNINFQNYISFTLINKSCNL